MGSGPPGGSWMTGSPMSVQTECRPPACSPSRAEPRLSRDRVEAAVAHHETSSGHSHGTEKTETRRPAGGGGGSRGSGHLTCAEHGAARPSLLASTGNGDTSEKGLKRLF